MERGCKNCGVVKPLTDKYFKPFTEGKCHGWRHKCRDCSNAELRKIHVMSNPKFAKRMTDYLKRTRAEVKSRYGIGLGTIRRLGLKNALHVYERDERCCASCKSEYNLDVHHKDGQGRIFYEKTKKPMNNDVSNLVLLCRSCHKKDDAIRRWNEKHKHQYGTCKECGKTVLAFGLCGTHYVKKYYRWDGKLRKRLRI